MNRCREPARRKVRVSRKPDSAQETRALTSAVIGLPVAVRDVFLLHRMAGLSYAEIAHRLDLDIHLVENRLSEALIALGQAVPFETTR